MKIEGRHSLWSVTINNPQAADFENMNLARQKGWKVEGQQEVGKNGTPHLQLFVRSGQQRFNALKEAFPRAHIEVCRDKTALEKYVHKEKTRVAELPVTDDFYPSQQKTWDMFAHWLDTRYTETDARSNGIELFKDERWLEEFDAFVYDLIQDGYVLEGIAVNPQVRSGLKKFGYSIYLRSKRRKYGNYVRRQIDRQTDEFIVGGSTITNAESSSGSEGEEDEGEDCVVPEYGSEGGSEDGSEQADCAKDGE